MGNKLGRYALVAFLAVANVCVVRQGMTAWIAAGWDVQRAA